MPTDATGVARRVARPRLESGHGRTDAESARVAPPRGDRHPPRRAGARSRPVRRRSRVARRGPGRPGARAAAAHVPAAGARDAARDRRAELNAAVPAPRRADTVQRAVAATGTADHLAWEARQRRPAAIAAILAAVLTLAGSVYGGIVFSDVPRGGLLESLERAARPGAVAQLPSLRIPVYQFYNEHAAGVLASTVLRALGLIGLGWALTYLAVATRARRPAFPRFAQYLPIIGAILSALATLLSTVATIIAVSDFLDGPRTVANADEITQNGLLVTAQLLNLPGLLALAVGIVLTALNAMRSGLLTRFMGVLGM